MGVVQYPQAGHLKTDWGRVIGVRKYLISPFFWFIRVGLNLSLWLTNVKKSNPHIYRRDLENISSPRQAWSVIAIWAGSHKKVPECLSYCHKSFGMTLTFWEKQFPPPPKKKKEEKSKEKKNIWIWRLGWIWIWTRHCWICPPLMTVTYAIWPF